MVQDMWNLLIDRREFFGGLLWEHVEVSIIAILLAVVIGGAMGILISEYNHTTKISLGVINFLYTIPSISMLGFLIPFSGVGNATAIIALTIYALLPMVRNTYTGIANVEPAILEAAKGMGSTRSQVLVKIKIPLAMPVIISGIRSMVTMTIALAGIASFIGAGGLGVAIYRGITTNNAAMTMVGSLLIALLALVVDFVLGYVVRQTKRCSAKSKQRNTIMAVVVGILCVCILASAVFKAQKKDILHIATKPMTEQYILGEMLEYLIEQDTDLEVEITQGVGGGTANIQPAMESGEFDLYPEYTGTGWNAVLKHEELYTEDLFATMEEEYAEAYNMQWVGMYGFNNTYGLVVRKEIAEQYDLKSYSDLSAVAGQLVFGAEYDFFEREDGYDALCDTYNLEFDRTMDLDIGLKYEAMNQQQLDVMVVFTTDGQLSASDVVVLEDDKGFYPSYMCGNVIRTEILEAYPQLSHIVNKVTGLITDADMAQMNYQVESEGEEPEEVAMDFLVSHNLLEEE